MKTSHVLTTTGLFAALAATAAFAQEQTPAAPPVPTPAPAPAASNPWPATVTVLQVHKGEGVEDKGVVRRGVLAQDLSMVTCMPASRRALFRGHTVLYAAALPPQAKVTVNVAPTRSNKHLAVFAYTVDDNRFDLPSSRATPRSCSVAAWSPNGPARSRIQLETGARPENLVVGVSGPGNMLDTDYTLTIEVR